MSTEAYPLQWPDGWPRARRRERARFDCTFDRSRRGLINEIRLMEGERAAAQAVLSTNLPLRGDGYPYAKHVRVGLEDPGVAVYWRTRGGDARCMACDRWDRVQDNVRALERSLGALRGLERWGGSPIVQRAFEGFQRLEAPARTPWNVVLAVAADAPPEEILAAYRSMRSATHPDRPDGNAYHFQRVQEAFEEAKAAGLLSSREGVS